MKLAMALLLCGGAAWAQTARQSAKPAQAEMVAGYLQKVRETGDFGYLDRATKIVDAILREDPASTLALRYQNEIDLQWHRFREVAERAGSQAKYDPGNSGNWGNLGDALMELGEYEKAGQAYVKMVSLHPGLESYNRLAWHRWVTGDAPAAIELMRMAVEAGNPTPQNVAWCRAELGDMYFKTGRPDDAEREYRASLELFPTLHRAMAGLGRVQKARGDLAPAIQSFNSALAVIPLPEYAGALEDLYTANGQSAKAREQRDRIEAIEVLGRAAGEKTNRNLALYYADHDRNLDRALALIEVEAKERPDVYTWDAYSWVLYKLHRMGEAREASAKALAHNTPEPMFGAHAAAICRP